MKVFVIHENMILQYRMNPSINFFCYVHQMWKLAKREKKSHPISDCVTLKSPVVCCANEKDFFSFHFFFRCHLVNDRDISLHLCFVNIRSCCDNLWFKLNACRWFWWRRMFMSSHLQLEGSSLVHAYRAKFLISLQSFPLYFF